VEVPPEINKAEVRRRFRESYLNAGLELVPLSADLRRALAKLLKGDVFVLDHTRPRTRISPPATPEAPGSAKPWEMDDEEFEEWERSAAARLLPGG
jgi:hypothetical protein